MYELSQKSYIRTGYLNSLWHHPFPLPSPSYATPSYKASTLAGRQTLYPAYVDVMI